jgi:transposase
VTAAISASRTKGTSLRDKFHRLKARMPAKTAAVTIAHKILVAAFHMLRRGVAFADLGADCLDRVDKHRTARRLVRRLDALGYDVMPRSKAAA